MTAAAALPNIGRLPDGRLVTSSRRLAAVCGRGHGAVGDAIRKAKAAYPELEAEFIDTTYRARNGRDYAAWYLRPRALNATFRFLENIPGRFDKFQVLLDYWGLFVQTGAVTYDDLKPLAKTRPRRTAAPEPVISQPTAHPERCATGPWPAWAITEGHLINAVWDELLAGEAG